MRVNVVRRLPDLWHFLSLIRIRVLFPYTKKTSDPELLYHRTLFATYSVRNAMRGESVPVGVTGIPYKKTGHLLSVLLIRPKKPQLCSLCGFIVVFKGSKLVCDTCEKGLCVSHCVSSVAQFIRGFGAHCLNVIRAPLVPGVNFLTNITSS